VNQSLNESTISGNGQVNPAANENMSPANKQPAASAFAPRPRPSGSGSDIGGLTRHTSLPYRTKKSAGSSTYQALTEDPLPPRLPTTPPPMTPNSEQEFWLSNTTPGFTPTNTTVTVAPTPQASQVNPFNQNQPQPLVIQQQAGFTQIQQPAAEQQSPNPFASNSNSNPFGERYV